MTLPAGDRIGHYTITAAIGAGGMGEVYRARDTQLDRDVAIKILPALFSQDTERLARFEREAKTLASLNHPHIAQIYGLEGFDGGRALVMELVDGEDLSDRIARGALPIDNALAIARQIVDALEAAHERGVIHRDLKPANIKVREDGHVKVLDFGLAKSMDPSGASGSAIMNSPTITSPATQLGMIIGTAAYMSPEQAKGRAVDRRADVWAFGVVLFEMLTGRRLFEGDEVTDVLASVLKDAPAHDTLPAHTPPAIRRLLRRCLEKDRAKRLDSMAAARMEIDDALGAREDVVAPRPSARIGLGRAAAAIGATAVAASLLGGAAVWRSMLPEPPSVARFALSPPDGVPLRMETNHHDVAIARDGSRIVYWGHDAGGVNRLFVRPAGSFDTTVVDGGDGARGMFLSHDGAWIGFQAGGATGEGAALMKVPVGGGAPSLVARIDGNLRNGAWGADGMILYATHRTVTGLFRVRASGGEPEQLTTPNRAEGEIDHVWPSWLPGGTHALFAIRRQGASDIALLDVASRTFRVLVKDGTMPSYATSGHLLYAHAGALNAVPFDLRRMEVTGERVRAIDGVVTKDSGAADYAVSEEGTLIYMPGTAATPRMQLLTVDRAGKRTALEAEHKQYRALKVSHDGRLAAVSIEDDYSTGLWVLDFERLTLTRLSPPGISVTAPVWSPDDRFLAFGGIPVSAGSGFGGIYRVPVAGTALPELLLANKDDASFRKVTTDWSPDGERLVFVDVAEGSAALMELHVTNRKVTELLNTPANDTAGTISPDGRWLAHVSTDTGRQEVYVRPYPNVGDDRIAVTSAGGRAPVWRSDGRELIVRDRSGNPVSVPVTYAGGAIRFGKPASLVVIRDTGAGFAAPFPDGSKFLFASAGSSTDQAKEYRVVLNWFEELKAKFAPAK